MFSDRLRFLRKQQQMTQEELANKLGVVQSTIGHWENNKRVPDFIQLCNIADLFDVTTDYLLCRTDGRQSIVKTLEIDGGKYSYSSHKDFPELTADEIIELKNLLTQNKKEKN